MKKNAIGRWLMVGSLSVLACACRSDGNMETDDGDDADYSCENPASTEPAESESVVVVEEAEPEVPAASQETVAVPPVTESNETSAAPAVPQSSETPSSVALTPAPAESATSQK